MRSWGQEEAEGVRQAVVNWPAQPAQPVCDPDGLSHHPEPSSQEAMKIGKRRGWDSEAICMT